METTVWVTAGTIFLLTLVFEDAAVLAGAFLASTNKIPWSLSFAVCVSGVLLGNVMLYFVARYFGRHAVDRLIPQKLGAREMLDRTQALFNKHGWLALVFCRFLPGSRLPTYLTAGVIRMGFPGFLLGSSIFATVWVLLFFIIFHQLGSAAPELFKSLEHNAELVVVGFVAIAGAIWLLRKIPWLRKRSRPSK